MNAVVDTAPETPAQAACGDDAAHRRALEHMLALARFAEALALGIVGKVRAISIIGLVSAAWLGFCVFDAFGLGAVFSGFVAIVLAVPGLALHRIHSLLRDAIGLPDRLGRVVVDVQGKSVELRREFASVEPAAPKPRGLRGLMRLLRTLRELRGLRDEAVGVVSALGGTVVLGNPLFVFVTGASIAAVLLLALVAATTAIAWVV